MPEKQPPIPVEDIASDFREAIALCDAAIDQTSRPGADFQYEARARLHRLRAKAKFDLWFLQKTSGLRL